MPQKALMLNNFPAPCNQNWQGADFFEIIIKNNIKSGENLWI